MKKGIIAIQDNVVLSDVVRKDIEKIAKDSNAEIVGCAKYPRGLILTEPKAFVDMMRKIDIDYIFLLNPDYADKENSSKDKSLASFYKTNLKIIDLALDVDLNHILDFISDEMKKEPKINVHENHLEQYEIMAITKEFNSSKLSEIKDALNTLEYNTLNVVEITEFNPLINDVLLSVIIKDDIKHIVIVDDYSDTNIEDFLKQLEERNIKITYTNKNRRKSNNINFNKYMC